MEKNILKNETKKEKRDILSDGIYLGKLINLYSEDNYIKMDFTVQDNEKAKMFSIWVKEDHKVWLNKKLIKYATEQQLWNVGSVEGILNKIYVPLKFEWKNENGKNILYKKII